MGKTPEQYKADDQLEEAVKAVVAAYDQIPSGSLITDYFVIGEAARYADDGDAICDLFLAFRNGHCRLTTTLGMLELGKRHLMAMWDHEPDD